MTRFYPVTSVRASGVKVETCKAVGTVVQASCYMSAAAKMLGHEIVARKELQPTCLSCLLSNKLVQGVCIMLRILHGCY